MPTISLLKKKKISSNKNSKKLKYIAKLYNSNKWQKLRSGYLIQHPLCEKCLENNRVTQACEVHHIKPISKGMTELEMMEIAYNPNNIIALCIECHHKIHKQMNNKKREAN